MHSKIFVNADGGSRGNPGRAAIGVVIRDENKEIILAHKEVIGMATNNEAEYFSLIKSLELAQKYTGGEVDITMDSELVIKHMLGKYKVKAENLRLLYNRVKNLEKKFSKVEWNHISRNNPFQSEADRLVNLALDGK